MFYNSSNLVLDGTTISNRILAPYKGKVQGDGSVEFSRARDGHFYIQAQINNRNITFLLDTGATDIVLSHKDALHAGIDVQNISNFKIYETAKGFIEAKIVEIPEMKIGHFLISNVQASVNSYSMSRSLLGMSFLKHFDFMIKDDTLILYRS
ncbi:TIGR02281 family clan AA aspartic protease [Wolbachia pipientis]|nr:TIGR02281 family clan AA aspartic protease [Wolbachia pipientis]